MVANPARGHRSRKMIFSPSPFAPENLVSRYKIGEVVHWGAVVLLVALFVHNVTYVLYVRMATHRHNIAKVWINRVRFPILLVVS